MKRGILFARGMVILAAGVLFMVAFTTAGTPGPRNPFEFSLTATGGDPAPHPFTLAPLSTDPTALAGPGGLGVIEDSDWPYRTALGYMALGSNSEENNTAIGYNALFMNQGNNNTGIGAFAFGYSGFNGNYNTGVGSGVFNPGPTHGDYNTGIGARAFGGIQYTAGSFNTAVGFEALVQGAGSYSTAAGARALANASQGIGNTAVGYAALENVGAGRVELESYNTALGYNAGSLVGGVTGQANYNIYIGANQKGDFLDSHTMRLGLPYAPGTSGDTTIGQNRTFIAGIVESPLASGDSPAIVGITSEGRLGTMSNDLLPQGPQGPQGDPGPAGEGLISGSLIFLRLGVAPPQGYILLGRTSYLIKRPNGTMTEIAVNIFQKR
jgi:hypothetical protein